MPMTASEFGAQRIKQAMGTSAFAGFGRAASLARRAVARKAFVNDPARMAGRAGAEAKTVMDKPTPIQPTIPPVSPPVQNPMVPAAAPAGSPGAPKPKLRPPSAKFRRGGAPTAPPAPIPKVPGLVSQVAGLPGRGFEALGRGIMSAGTSPFGLGTILGGLGGMYRGYTQDRQDPFMGALAQGTIGAFGGGALGALAGRAFRP